MIIRIWRSIIIGDWKSWVLFAHGTCVILEQPVADLVAAATGLLREHGPVVPGSAAGDFGVIKLGSHPGWVVTGSHPDLLNYVAPDDLAGPASDLAVGMVGRSARAADAAELRGVHVEDKRKKEDRS
jgi:hypothetical protein